MEHKSLSISPVLYVDIMYNHKTRCVQKIKGVKFKFFCPFLLN